MQAKAARRTGARGDAAPESLPIGASAARARALAGASIAARSSGMGNRGCRLSLRVATLGCALGASRILQAGALARHRTFQNGLSKPPSLVGSVSSCQVPPESTRPGPVCDISRAIQQGTLQGQRCLPDKRPSLFALHCSWAGSGKGLELCGLVGALLYLT